MKAIAGGSSTNKITVYYSQGSAKRAIALRTMVEGAMSFYEQWLGVRVPIELVVLNKVDWVQLGSIPYGIPYPEHTTLEDFERQYLDVGFSNYSWYETQFLQRAMQVYERKGLSFLSEIRTLFPADEKGPLSVDVVLGRLEKVAPGFVQWADGLKMAGK